MTPALRTPRAKCTCAVGRVTTFTETQSRTFSSAQASLRNGRPFSFQAERFKVAAGGLITGARQTLRARLPIAAVQREIVTRLRLVCRCSCEILMTERPISEHVRVIELAQPPVKGTDAILVDELRSQIGVGETGE